MTQVSDRQNSQTATTPNTDAISDRVAAATETWKRKLLDLSKRNRALKFRPNKVSTIAVVDELPAAVFRQLYVLEQAMKFSAAPDEAVHPAVADEEADLDADIDPSLEVDFVPYDASSVAERHSDEWLQTNRSPTDLQKSLRRIEELSRQSLEEQGVNTLFLAIGMLHYYDSPDSDEVLRAPLVFLPVQLTRKGAKDQYRLVAGNDDPIVNPSLREYLLRSFGMSLPMLPEVEAIDEAYDLQVFLSAVTKAAEKETRWSVKTDIYLSLFSFHKYVMYKDLEAGGTALQHREAIQRLVTRSGGHVRQLPAEIEALQLDDAFPPETTMQVVDADASQIRALAAVARGYDLVIEGPPGTGKSQTITNIIAQALAEGSSVLFVAEKMAALSVVYDRLKAVGLADYCLELHSTKANRRQVLADIARALDAAGARPPHATSSTQSLPDIRATLSNYSDAVHTPFGALQESPFKVFGEADRLRSAPRIGLNVDARNIDRATLEDAVRRLKDVVAASDEIRPLHDSPWRDSTHTYYSQDNLDDIRSLAVAVRRCAVEVRTLAAKVEHDFFIPPITTRNDVLLARAIASAMRNSPGAPESILVSNEWNAPPAVAVAWIDRLGKLAATTELVLSQFNEDVLSDLHASDIAFIQNKHASIWRFVALLDRRYRAIRRLWLSYRRPGYGERLHRQAADLQRADTVQSERAAIDAAAPDGTALFGALWAGWRSDASTLSRYVDWVVAFRATCLRYSLSERTIQLAARPTPDVTEITKLGDVCERLFQQLTSLRSMIGWSPEYLDTDTFQSIQERTEGLGASIEVGPRWASFEAARQAALATIAAPAVRAAMGGEIDVALCVDAFSRAFVGMWLEAVSEDRPLLRSFSGITHEQRVREFAELDKRVILENQARLLSTLQARRRGKLVDQSCKDALAFLQHEIGRTRRGSALRVITAGAEPAIRALKPCFLMSPLSVAQYLKNNGESFDLVVFDEASQLPPEEAVGGILRGKQVVVVGDPKQLPPTDFFQNVSDAPSVDDDDPNAYTGDTESILDEIMGAGVPMSRLRWHYRSAHESLIAFSNAAFYDSDLIIFPSVTSDRMELGLSFEFVPNGVYEGKGLNLAEAHRVADAVVEFARAELENEGNGIPRQSLGVATFNLRQQRAIQELLEARRVSDPSIEPFFDQARSEKFFIKNLENIQGDERDHIFLSVTYGKAHDGQLRYNFGALNGKSGPRRLNVLVTRARRRMRVYSSMRASDMNPTGLTNYGPALLKEFLRYAETGRLDGPTVNLAATTESPFEREVLLELRHRGLEILPQVGVGKYRLDFGVIDPEFPGEYLCGIECDGAAYHSSETARDRDRLRQQVLEGRGWKILRIWSTDWWKDRAGQVDRIMRNVKRISDDARTARSTHDDRNNLVTSLAGTATGQLPSMQEVERNIVALPSTYERPSVAVYAPVEIAVRQGDEDILSVPNSRMRDAVMQVVEGEAPLHIDDLVTRVAGLWGTRGGSRIRDHIIRSYTPLIRDGFVDQAGDFLYMPGRPVRVRARNGAIPAERIAPEEYSAAARLVLGNGATLARDVLTGEIRAALGFARTGAKLEQEINKAIDGLLSRGIFVHAATGVRYVDDGSEPNI